MALHFANQSTSYFRRRQQRHRGSDSIFNTSVNRISQRHHEHADNNNTTTYTFSQYKKEHDENKDSIAVPDWLKSLFKNKSKKDGALSGVKHITKEQLEQPHNCKEYGCTRVVINCGGTIFETQERTLNRFPNTLLGNPKSRRQFWDPHNNQYFLDRHAPTFEAVLFFYQSGGRLHQPKEVPDEVFLKELEEYQLGLTVMNEFRLRTGYIPEDEIIMPEGEIKRKIWTAFEHPNSSWLAMAVTIMSICSIITSIVCLCLETLPELNQDEGNTCIVIDGGSRYLFQNPFFITESVCVSWFIIELTLRFLSCPDKYHFAKSVMNIFDFLAIAPYLIGLFVTLANPTCDNERKDVSFAFLRVLRLLRVFRVFRLSKHSKGLKILILTIERSAREIVLFAFFLAVSVILFAAALYYAEISYPDTKIISIPEGFWWAIITMTTVGYGDVHPTTLVGKMIGSLCVIAGVLTVALLVPIVVTNFNNFYIHQSEKAMASSQRETNYAEKRQEKKRIYKWATEQQYFGNGLSPRDGRKTDTSPRDAG